MLFACDCDDDRTRTTGEVCQIRCQSQYGVRTFTAMRAYPWRSHQLSGIMALGFPYKVGTHKHLQILKLNLRSVPAAAPALALAIFAIPSNFPYHGQTDRPRRNFKTLITKQTRKKLDFLGATLLLLASLSLTAAFEEAGSQFPWKSAYVITLLIVSGFLWIGLVVWERHVTRKSTPMEPVLPWRFMTDRAMLSLLL
jgi:hypothetical protein